jgi:pimeloyl-ACP methyl ester carboxylesterase
MAVGSWPEAFGAKQMVVADWTQYVRLGGKGPGLVLLHGFGDTGDMWVPLADALVKDHAVIVPDLRGMGLSSHPEGGYEKVAQARDLATILDQLGFQEVALVTHEIGNMVGYAFAALFKRKIGRIVDRPTYPSPTSEEEDDHGDHKANRVRAHHHRQRAYCSSSSVRNRRRARFRVGTPRNDLL